MLQAPQANRDQAVLWNTAGGDIWVEMQDVLDRMFAPVEEVLVDAGFPGEGGRVLDIGCGAGATTLAMARRLGPAGRALGVDISEPLIEAAKDQAAGAADFLAADAQTCPFEAGAFDAAISRFGVMFFEDPVAAFANIRRAVRPGGRMVFAAWRSPADNPFMTAATRAAKPFLPDLPRFEPDAPGQFGFAREERVRQVLGDSGWREVRVEPLDVDAAVSDEDLDRYVVRMGPVGIALQGLDEAAREPVALAVRAAFDPFRRDGKAEFGMACWLVTAEA